MKRFEVVSVPDLVGGYRVQNTEDGEVWDKVGGVRLVAPTRVLATTLNCLVRGFGATG
jgi:hypothetical protein